MTRGDRRGLRRGRDRQCVGKDRRHPIESGAAFGVRGRRAPGGRHSRSRGRGRRRRKKKKKREREGGESREIFTKKKAKGNDNPLTATQYARWGRGGRGRGKGSLPARFVIDDVLFYPRGRRLITAEPGNFAGNGERGKGEGVNLFVVPALERPIFRMGKKVPSIAKRGFLQ